MLNPTTIAATEATGAPVLPPSYEDAAILIADALKFWAPLEEVFGVLHGWLEECEECGETGEAIYFVEWKGEKVQIDSVDELRAMVAVDLKHVVGLLESKGA